MAKYLTQPQSAERLFGWQDGNQGKAAKEKAKEQQARKDRTRKNIYIAKGPWPIFNGSLRYTPRVELCKINKFIETDKQVKQKIN